MSKEGSTTKDKVINSQHSILLPQLSDQHIVERLENKKLVENIDRCCKK